MWISTKAQYGLRALIEIGKRPGEAVPLKDVAEKQDISQHYLEQLAAQLRRSGFIRSVRGAHGGYRLARSPELIQAWDVVVAMEGSLSPVSCLEDEGNCERAGACATEGLWRRVEEAVRDVLGGTTLADLIHENLLIEQSRLVQLETNYLGR
ncbi:RrF2 family transcriptional regulator [Deinococcus peraridilitoris]|uniref:Rrf2 family protein, putative transcriptional regulator n=1 Tax=Deinococcus peraridilitoris (strain DSM 19664 / LMG 22246 / CIP 109416 / KR-200) TaxID=937777 RepID=L0A766_DEIPD|nr:RrF2 family transcriptional regulator [Deinococcus peraridilitoris]AFZ68900.1 rrf2 family protein, putative transcriptional regulator [Deinococcus peraridilitoris DSM 19664]